VSTLLDQARAGQPLDCPVVDVHGHLGPCPNFHIPDHSPTAMVAAMDRVGINALCVSSHTAIYADFVLGNDETQAAVEEFPTRFVGAVVLNPHYPDEIVAELGRRMRHGGFRLIKLHSTLQKFRLPDELCEPVWREAESRDVPVLVHSWAGAADCGFAACDAVATRHPDVKLILGHSLAPDGFADACRLVEKHPNVYLDTATSQVNYGQIDFMVDRIGSERILFGSDTPFLDPAPQLGKVVFARIDEVARRSILGANAARLLRL